MSVPDTNQHPVVQSIRALDMAMHRLRSALAARHGLTMADTTVLSYLTAGGGHGERPGDIATHLGIGSGTLTAMLDRLERAGLVSRVRNPRDRRSMLIQLTSVGSSAVADSTRLLVAAIDAAIAAEQQASFAEQVAHIVAATEQVIGDAGTAEAG
jgi:DNA-binding MarR family transcriptional regulator